MRDITKEIVYENDNIIMFEVCEIVPAVEGKIQPSYHDIVGTITEISLTSEKRLIRYIYKQSKCNKKVLIEPLRSGAFYPCDMYSKINETISVINNE